MKNINDIWSLLGDDQEQLRLAMVKHAKSPVPLSNEVCEYLIEGGGKRVRPLVLMLLAKAMGYCGDKQYTLATAVEFIHTATLLHDDVVDESDMRRGKPTANSTFGNAAAVLVGDFLYTRGFQLVANELEAASLIADATNDLALGEVLQLVNVDNIDISEEDYYQVIHLKTAVLFSAACQFSAILAKRPDLAEPCKAYGNYMGRAFQIADDVLDYVGDVAETGKNIGDDLAEKKMTLPLIHALREASPKHAATLRDIIHSGDRNRIAELVDILSVTGSVQYAQKVADEQVALAKNSISVLPDTPFKQALELLAEMTVRRKQ